MEENFEIDEKLKKELDNAINEFGKRFELSAKEFSRKIDEFFEKKQKTEKNITNAGKMTDGHII